MFSRISRRITRAVLTAAILLSPALLSAAPPAPEPEINAASAVLIDAKTGTVLFEKNPDMQIPPASMTKLMTIHTALRFINEGIVSADAPVPISAAADFRSLPPRSSLMFIEEGQKVSLIELLQGLALPSGNDAGIAVAEYLAGSVDAFVALMNDEAARLGMRATHFDDSSGLSEKNITTAREYAGFCRTYIEENGKYLAALHSPASFTYPKEENLPGSGASVHGPITQPNHNLLIGRMASVDGLKTGYIDESGYNFAATAAQDGRRLILVTMGGPGKNSSDGALRRAIDAAALLSYGFYAWSEYAPAAPAGRTVETPGGERDELRVSFSRPAEILIQTAAIDGLEFTETYRDFSLPVTAGTVIGEWALKAGGGEVIQRGLISAAEDMKKGNIFRRFAARVYSKTR